MELIVGTTHAPPLTTAELIRYKGLIKTLDESHTKVVLTKLLNLVVFWDTLPESNTAPKTHPSGRCQVVGLSEEISATLKPHIPYAEELKMFADVLEKQAGEIRNIGFHLLWYATELNLGREPVTLDKLT